MMNKTRIVLFCLCLFLFTTSFGVGGDGTTSGQTRNNSEEISSGEQNSKQTKCQFENDEKDCDNIDYINSNETGPLDSHEAMNTRELKARNKRSTEVDKKAFRNMLLGLVHKKSSSQDMKVELHEDIGGNAGDAGADDVVDDASEIRVEPQKFQSDASELLLELMVRIAAHPQQWDEVHELLQRIDTDIVTSKKILTNLKKDITSSESTTTQSSTTTTTTTESSSTTEIDEVQKLIILLDNEEHYANRKKTNESHKVWPNLDDDDIVTLNNNSQQKQNIYPWSNNININNNNKASTASMSASSVNVSDGKNSTTHEREREHERDREREREFEFAYHRVTGLPLPYRSNYDKTRARNAYIAVSVIAPKSRDVVRLEKQDNLLEDELRQLKPWSHEENLSKMENIRKKWFIRSDNTKPIQKTISNE